MNDKIVNTYHKLGEKNENSGERPKMWQSLYGCTEEELFLVKIGEVIKLRNWITRYEAKITGGSDKDGFPMSRSIVGQGRRKILTKDALGFKASKKENEKEFSVRGNTISKEIAQLNVIITKRYS